MGAELPKEGQIEALIVDDDKRGADALHKMIKSYCPSVHVRAVVHSAQEARAEIKRKQPQLLFLDIQMPSGDGFSLLESLDYMEFGIIFITAYDKYAIKAIRFAALDYLLKPISIDELQEAVARFRRRFVPEALGQVLQQIKQEGAAKSIGVPSLTDIRFVALDQIVRIAAEGNYSKLFLASGERLTSSYTLKHYDQLIGGQGFMRVHHSHLISLAHVQRYVRGKGGTVLMSDGAEVDVAQRRKEAFLTKMGIQ